MAQSYNAHPKADPGSSLFRSCQNFCKSAVLNLWLFDLLPPSSVLDLGCGRGGDCGKLPSHLTYTGVDIAEASLEEARRRFPRNTFLRADFCDANFKATVEGPFAAAWSSFAFHYGAYELDATLANVGHVLLPNSPFLLMTMDFGMEDTHPQGFGPLSISKWEHRDTGSMGTAHASTQAFVSVPGCFENLPEPVITMQQMKAACEASGFELIKTELLGTSVQQMADWAETPVQQAQRARLLELRSFYRDAFMWDATHWEFSNCYRMWLLKKTS